MAVLHDGERDDESHWAARGDIPITAILIWVAGLVLTALGLFGAGLIGR
jgi:hypothetical protein